MPKVSELLTAEASRWVVPARNRHELQAVVTPDDDDGGFTICAMHYPGVISEGDTLKEAIGNLGDAFLLMLESRREHGETMMYSDAPVTEIPSNSQIVRVVIDG